MDAARPPPAKLARRAAVLSDRASGAAAGSTMPSCGLDESLMEMLYTDAASVFGCQRVCLACWTSAPLCNNTLTKPAHGWCQVPPQCLLLLLLLQQESSQCFLVSRCLATWCLVLLLLFLLQWLVCTCYTHAFMAFFYQLSERNILTTAAEQSNMVTQVSGQSPKA
jgi:hypothetical protein